METHVKVLGALNIAFGALGMVVALVLMLVFGVSAGAVGVSGDPDAAFAAPIIGITGTVVVTFLVMLSLPGIIIGIGLLKLRPWARIAGIVVSIMSLIAFPFGTVLGAYGLWVLFSKDTERLFSPAAIT
jgi:hypothetical protein